LTPRKVPLSARCPWYTVLSREAFIFLSLPLSSSLANLFSKAQKPDQLILCSIPPSICIRHCGCVSSCLFVFICDNLPQTFSLTFLWHYWWLYLSVSACTSQLENRITGCPQLIRQFQAHTKKSERDADNLFLFFKHSSGSILLSVSAICSSPKYSNLRSCA
jgi:hypothetical protein